MRAQLIPLEGGTPLEITKDITVVGRKEEADLQIDHKSISKMHCILVKSEGMLLLRDLGSTNGTRKNDQRVRRAVLLLNDNLTIAHFKFRVSFGPDESAGGKRPVSPDEYTQQIEAKDVPDALRRAKEEEDDSDEVAGVDLRSQDLPDAYPEDRHEKHK